MIKCQACGSRAHVACSGVDTSACTYLCIRAMSVKLDKLTHSLCKLRRV